MICFQINSLKQSKNYTHEIALFYFEEDNDTKQEADELFNIYEEAFNQNHQKYSIVPGKLREGMHEIIIGEGFGEHLIGISKELLLNKLNSWGTKESRTEQIHNFIDDDLGVTVQYKIVIE